MSIVNTKFLSSLVAMTVIFIMAFPAADIPAANVKDVFTCTTPSLPLEKNLLYTGNDATSLELPKMTRNDDKPVTVTPILFSVCNTNEERTKKNL